MKLTVPELATDLQHEAMHCMLSHHERYETLKDPEPDLKVFNIAGDCSINHVIEESGFQFAKTFPPVRYRDFPEINSTMTTEQAYFRLKKRSEGGGKSRVDQDCGSAAGGKPRGYEVAPDNAEVPAAASELKAAVKTQVAAEITKSKSRPGQVPGELIRWADDYLSPKINWRRQLAVRVRVAMATKAGRRDYSMMRPSRREQGMTNSDRQIRLPSMRQPGDPNVTVVVDTSGSISDDTLKETLTEVIGITRAVGHSGGIWVIPCDYVAYSAAKVRTAADVKSLKFPGGGGTDMRAGIRAALDSKQKPDVVVVVTDGFTPWPDEKPTGCDNFIVLLTEEAKRDSVPQWGKTVYLELDSD